MCFIQPNIGVISSIMYYEPIFVLEYGYQKTTLFFVDALQFSLMILIISCKFTLCKCEHVCARCKLFFHLNWRCIRLDAILLKNDDLKVASHPFQGWSGGKWIMFLMVCILLPSKRFVALLFDSMCCILPIVQCFARRI